MHNNENRARRAMIFRIAFPIIVQNIVMHMQILIDRAFLGNLHSRYLAAIGNVMVPFEALMFCFFAAANGLTILIAQNIGAKKMHEAKRLGESSYAFTSLFSTSLFFLWFFGANGILSTLGASGTILKDAETYVRFLSISLIFMGIDVSSASILQGVGQTKPIMFFGIMKSLINIVLDWAMIFGHLGFPSMGLAGAALATTIANAAGAIGLFLTVILTKKLPFTVNIRSILRPAWKTYSPSIKLGLPSGIETFLWYSGQLVLTRFMNSIDAMAIGIFSLISGIQVIGVLIYLGFATASTTLVGQAWGAQDFKEAKRVGLYCLRLSMMVTVCCATLFLLFPRFLIQIFTSDSDIISRAVPLLRMIAIFINLDVVNILMGHCIRATGDTRWMLYSQIFGTVFVISCSSLLIYHFSLGLVGMYLTMIMDEFIRGGINFFRFVLGENPFIKWFRSTGKLLKKLSPSQR